MRRSSRFVIVLALGAGQFAGAQSVRDGGPSRGNFAAPVVKATTLRGQGAVMFGGRGGWALSPSVTLGAGAYGTVTEVNAAEGAVPLAPGPLDIAFETFALDVEYAARRSAPTHLTYGLSLGGGAQHNVRDKTREQFGETDFMLLLEPSLGVERRVTATVHLQVAASYRLLHGVEQIGIRRGDLQGAAVSVALKVGRF